MKINSISDIQGISKYVYGEGRVWMVYDTKKLPIDNDILVMLSGPQPLYVKKQIYFEDLKRDYELVDLTENKLDHKNGVWELKKIVNINYDMLI